MSELAFADAPVLGTKQPAEQGELVILAAGPDELKERVEPLFAVIGKRSMWVGAAGGGTRLKLATNSWLLAVVEGAAETLALAEGMLDLALPLVATIRKRLDEGVAEHGDEDLSATYLTSARVSAG